MISYSYGNSANLIRGEYTWLVLGGASTLTTALGRREQPTKRENPIPPPPPGQDKEITNSIGMKLALIPKGKFWMGSPEGETSRDADEGPQHEVEITKPFYLGVFEVTQEQYQKVTGNNPSYFNKEKVGQDTSEFPVENVSWEDARAFCEKLSNLLEESKAGCVYRLPTEAEWEYACRGRAILKKEEHTVFHYGNSLSSTQANFDGKYPYGGAGKGDYLKRTTKVGSYQSNDFGLYDMHGNVWEWCEDWHDANYYKRSPRQDPHGPEKSPENRRVLRGGSWYLNGRYCRSANRPGLDPGARNDSSGFRVVCVAGVRVP